MITQRLINVTPELNDDERRAFFGYRSDEEQGQLADLFAACGDRRQREIVYDALRSWCADYARLN